MKAVEFPEQNKVYKAPLGYEDKCFDLGVWHGKDLHGDLFMISKWELDEDEIKKLIETKSIYLKISGQIHPMVNLTVDSPFVKIKEFQDCNCVEDFENLQAHIINLMEGMNPDTDEWKGLDAVFNECSKKIIGFKTNDNT